MNHGNFGTGKNNFGYIPEPNSGVCADAAFDERLCETCKYYEEHHGMPLCNGNEYEESFEHHWEMMDDIEREEYNALWAEKEIEDEDRG